MKDVGYYFLVFGMTFQLYFDLGKMAGLREKSLALQSRRTRSFSLMCERQKLTQVATDWSQQRNA